MFCKTFRRLHNLIKNPFLSPMSRENVFCTAKTQCKFVLPCLLTRFNHALSDESQNINLLNKCYPKHPNIMVGHQFLFYSIILSWLCTFRPTLFFSLKVLNSLARRRDAPLEFENDWAPLVNFLLRFNFLNTKC